MIGWIIENKDWLFSGVGVAIILGIGRYISNQKAGGLRPWRRGVSIAGHWDMRDWRHDYDYKYPDAELCTSKEEEERGRKHCESVELKQTGSRVTANFAHPDRTGLMVSYKLKGTVRGWTFAGTWWEVGNDPGKIAWTGTFQFLIEKGRDEPTMLGRWTGTDSGERTINCGVWEWRKRPPSGESSRREWPSEEGDLDLLRKSERNLQAFDKPNPEEPRPYGYHEFFWERLGKHPETKDLFEASNRDWESLPPPHRELCIWYHNEALRSLQEQSEADV